MLSFKIFLLLIIPIFSFSNLNAATYYSRATGNWNVNTTWSLTSNGPAVGTGVYPVAGDIVFIERNRTVTINANAACTNISVASGSTLSIGGFNFIVSGSTTISGTLENTSGNGTKTLGNVTISGGTWNTIANETFDMSSLILAGSTFSGNKTPTLNITGTMSVNSGTNTFGASTITVGGLTTVIGTLVFTTNSGTKTFNGGVTITGGTWATNGGKNETYTINGNLNLTNATINGSNVSVFTTSGNLTVGSGTTTINPATLTITGTTTVNGTFTVASTAGSKTFAGLVTVNSGGNWNFTVNESVVLRGGLTNNGTFTAGTGTYTFNTNASQTITGTISIPNLVINTPTNLTNNGTLTVSTGLSGTGRLTQASNSTLRIADAGTFSLTSLVASATGNTVEYYRNGNQTVRASGTTTSYYNLILSGSGTKTISGLTTVTGDFTTSGTITATTNTNPSLTIGGNLNIGAGTTFTVAAYDFTVSGSTVISGTHPHSSATGLKTYNGDVTINSGGSWTNTSNEGFTFNGNLENNGTLTSGTGIYRFEGTSKSLSGTSGLTIPNTTINGSYTNNTTLTVATALAGSGSLTQGSGQTLNIGGSSTITTLNASASNNTVNYTGAAQTIKNTNYYHLGLSGTNLKTLPSAGITIAGNFTTSGAATATSGAGYTFGGNVTLGSGTTLNSGTFSHSIARNWINNGATFNPSSGTFFFNGSSSQTIGGTANTTFNCFTVNNALGVVLGRAVNAACVTLSSGLLTTTSTNLLTVTGTTAGAITGSASSYVNGPLAWNLPAVSSATYSFPIGKSGYNPFELVNITTPGASTFTSEVFDANSGGTPGVGMSSLNTNRYWSATTSGSITSTQVRLTETVMPGVEDAIGQSSTQTGAYNRVSDDPPSGYSLTSSSTTLLTTLGYFAIGEKPIVNITATQDGTEGGIDGHFTLTTSKNFTQNRDVSLTISGTAFNGTDYSTITSPITFPAGQSSVQIPIQVIDDALSEPTETVIITLGNGAGYAIGSSSSATLNIFDNDAAEITVSPTSGLTTTEAGGQATFTLVLTSQPAASVSVGISTSDDTEGTVYPSSVTFTTGNWNTPQTVTITGVNDFVDDGDMAYTIYTAAATSTDANYNGVNPDDVSATNEDNDVAGINVSAISGHTSEAGETATFTIVLNSRPTADVTINLSSGNTNEGTVLPSSVTFVPAQWNTAKTVTVTGVDDDVVDGNVSFSIVTDQASSTDPLYAAINPSDVDVTNDDNDMADIVVSPTNSLFTDESGGQATFTIVLTSRPTSDVTITLHSDNTDEGTVSPASVTFIPSEWNSAKTITITGVDGLLDDGDITYHIILNSASSSDANYNGKDPDDVTVVNKDNDTAGITITPTSGLVTTEAGGTASFTIVLLTMPTNDVTISLSSSNINEGTVSPTLVTFTDGNWNSPRTITVTGVDDEVDDGNVAYTIITGDAVSVDPNYNGKILPDVSASNTNNDVAGITVSTTSGLITTEAGVQATFTIKLNSKPIADVTIDLSSSNTNEGTVSPSSVTFTSGNWSSTQTITVTGQNDDVDDDDVAYTIVTAPATSTDPKYSGRNAADVSVTNQDDDTAGFTFSATSGLNTTEAGGQATFTVRLNTKPTANVEIDLTSSIPAEGLVSPSALAFTTSNWYVDQTVTVTGQDDFVMDGDKPYTIITTMNPGTDAKYNTLNPPDVSVTNTDNDAAGFTVSPTAGLVTTEAGGQAIFTIKLTSQPIADVTIGLSSSNPQEGVVSPVSLTFTSGNWNSNQTVTITGVNDFIDDGDIAYTIVTAAATSTDTNYNGVNPEDVSVTNTDNDVAGITVSTISGNTTEDGGIATFTVVLTSQPTDNVTIGISSSNTAEGIVSPASLVFIPSEWNSAKTVTVTGVDDNVIDGSVAYTIVTAPATSSDANYSNRDASDVAVTNTDNDVAGIIVDPTSGLTSGEDGSQATFTIKLASIPTANVTIGLSSSNTNEGTVSPASLVITPANWNTENTVTITGINDDVDDDDKTYTIVTSSSSSTDANYHNLTVSDVTVTNTDNDDAGILVEPTSGLVTSENLTSATFTIVLETKPTANVKINLSVDDTKEGDVSPTSLTFTPANWNAPQTVTVTGKNDKQIDDDVVYNVVTAPASSTDPKYNEMDADDVEVTNLDNDSPGITVSPISGLITTEAGEAASFTVVLNTQPSNDVVINLSSSNTAEGTVSQASLTFTNSNWESPQTITISGVNDGLTDGDIAYAITLNPAVSEDDDYNAFDPDDVSVINTDLTPTITLGANPTICSETTAANLSYSAKTKSPNQYSIDYDATANAAGFTDVTNVALPSSPIVLTAPTGAPAGTYNATLTVRNSTYTACVSPVYSISVTINQKPATPTAGSNSPVCAGATLNLTASTVSGATYLWSGPNGFISTQQNPVSSNISGTAGGTYSVTVTVNGCTSDAGTTLVNVSPLVHTNLIQVE